MDSFIKHIKTHNIHGLLHLNKWGETWCYGLTKSLLSELPIFYNNIGSFKTRISKDIDKYFINGNSEDDFCNMKLLEGNFTKFFRLYYKE